VELVLHTPREPTQNPYHRANVADKCPRRGRSPRFRNAGSAITLIDRIVHDADIMSLEGDSYRRRVAEQTLTKRRATKDRSKFPRHGEYRIMVSAEPKAVARGRARHDDST
jgi:hypothetical protein